MWSDSNESSMYNRTTKDEGINIKIAITVALLVEYFEIQEVYAGRSLKQARKILVEFYG